MSQPTTSRLSRETDFVDRIRRTCADQPAARAALRRAMGRAPVDAVGAYRWIYDGSMNSPGDDDAKTVVAGLIALAPTAAGSGNLGDALARMAHARSTGSTGPARDRGVASAESRLILLCRQDQQSLCRQHLPHLWPLLVGSGSVPDPAELLRDLRWWDRDRDRIVRRWLQGFYAGTALTLYDSASETAN